MKKQEDSVRLQIKRLFTPIFSGLNIDTNPQPQYDNKNPCYAYIYITEIVRHGGCLVEKPSTINSEQNVTVYHGVYTVSGEIRISYNAGCEYNNAGYVQGVINKLERTKPELFTDVLTISKTTANEDTITVPFSCRLTITDTNNVGKVDGVVKKVEIISTLIN